LELNGSRTGGGEIGLSSQMEWLASDHWSLAAGL
jgi:hypothetical protein